MPEPQEDEFEQLVRSGLEARVPRRLPERFVPPAPRHPRAGWLAAAALCSLLLAAVITLAVSPELRSGILAGFQRLLPGVSSPSGPPPAKSPSPAITPALSPSSSAGTGEAPATTPAPQPSNGAPTATPQSALPPLPVPVPSLPPLPLPSLPPLPLPTPSLPPLPLPTPG